MKVEKCSNLIVEGSAFAKISNQPQIYENFMKLLISKETIVFSRLTPIQKFNVTKDLQKHGKRVLCVGDGINDVNMIQQAHVGVGI